MTADFGVAVRIHRPVPQLQSYVTFFYFVEAERELTDFLYPEWGNVRFDLGGEWSIDVPGFEPLRPQKAVLYGPTDRHGKIWTGGGRSLGFGMTPIGWHKLIGGDVSKMTNQTVPLVDQLGGDGEALRQALIADAVETDSIQRLEQLLLARLSTRPAVAAQVMAVDRALRRRPATVALFAADAGMSERSLHRLCLQTFGFPPKRLMRRQRFLDALGLARTAVGQAVGDSLGEDYFDQAHFYRDFRDFMAMSPRAYFSAPRPVIATASIAQIEAGVTLSFRLPPPPDGSP